jgi:hypothetical protein
MISIPARTVTVEDKLGASTVLHADAEGFVTVRVGGSPIYIEVQP